MRNTIIVITVLLALAVTPATAKDRASKQESVGVGVGAAIGAVAGGPVGLLLGAAVGAKLGDTLFAKDEELAQMTQSARVSEVRVAELQKDRATMQSNIDSLGSDIEHLQSVARPELLTLMQAGIEMDLLFRTDEDILTDTTGGRLQQLAASLATMPDVRIQLDGFADERGDAAYNQALSEKRVAHVQQVLINGGVPSARIKVTAHGESPSADTNIDSYALERKVSLTLFVEEQNSFAATP
jgi:outer membrane protein OmpA-like peptidoglycan-associated protein